SSLGFLGRLNPAEDTISSNGGMRHRIGRSASYTLNADCTVRAVFQDGLTFDGVIVAGGARHISCEPTPEPSLHTRRMQSAFVLLPASSAISSPRACLRCRLPGHCRRTSVTSRNTGLRQVRSSLLLAPSWPSPRMKTLVGRGKERYLWNFQL